MDSAGYSNLGSQMTIKHLLHDLNCKKKNVYLPSYFLHKYDILNA